MKILTKLMLLGLVGLLAAPFILKKPDGTPWLTWSDLFEGASDSASALRSQLPITNSNSQMYKWQDAAGKWHYSDRPSDDFQTETVKVDAAYNQMKHIELPEGFGESKRKQAQTSEQEQQPSLPLTTAPLEKVPDMLNDIERVQEKMDQRQRALDNL